jgi:hypothetical protein
MSDKQGLGPVANRLGLSILHPAVIEIVSLTVRITELEKELGRPFVIERGPWGPSDDGKAIYSDDFTHDVMLKVHGDFANDDQRKTYSGELARRLNNHV